MSVHDSASGETSKVSDDYVRVYYKGKSYLVPKEFILKKHPGGAEIILAHENSDVTEDFERVEHSPDAINMLEKWEETSTLSSECGKDSEWRELKSGETPIKTRWRSTAIAFTIAAIVAIWVLPQRKYK
ncbi:unnamed protein product [Phytomonas sp. EM1]|nr:unnamed protein product [Phytomonas sp. EM1]|eukprot:CCW61861.1 unnamed protein product [Phytomonas sp. isolate EM1]